MKKRPVNGEATRLIWDGACEEYRCEKCRAMLHWNYGFRICPYCGRRIAGTDERRARTRPDVFTGVILR